VSTGFLHKTLPDGAYKCRWEAEFYVLKKHKRMAYEANRTLHEGLRYLIWSNFSRCWYERVIDTQTLEDNIGYYAKAGLLWIWPTEESKETIRADVKKAGLSYTQLMTRRQNEIDIERHKHHGHKQNAWQYWQAHRRKIINSLKSKKR